MKAIYSFKASALKISVEIGQKEVTTVVSLDEFTQLKIKADIIFCC